VQCGAGRAARSTLKEQPIKGLVNFCWFFFKWGLILAAAGAVATIAVLYNRVDEQIRRQVEQKLASHYSSLSVHVRAARLVKGEGIEIRGLTISEPQAAGPQTELAHFDEIFLACKTDLKDLARGQPDITHIKVRRPTFRATRRPDGTWSTARLLPCPRFSDTAPIVQVEDGTVEIFDPLRNPSTTFTARDLCLTLKPQPTAGESRTFAIEGHLTADKVQRVELSGMLDANGGRWDLEGKVDAMEICPELQGALPADMAQRLGGLVGVRGEGKMRFSVTKDASLVPDIRFDVRGQITRGRIDHARLPYPLTDLKARFRCNNDGVTIDEVTARNGRTTVSCSIRRVGYEAASPIYIAVNARRLLVDYQFAEVMPDALRACWYHYLPEGEIDADVKLRFDGRNWTPDEATVQCLNTSFTYHQFPYRLERATGSLTLKDNRLDVRLTAYSGPEPIRVEGAVINPGPNFVGMIEIRADNMPFDEKLFAALKPEVGRVVRSLTPRGNFDVYARYGRPAADGPMSQHVALGLNRCSLNYDKFAYPVADIRGTIEMTDGQWLFHDLTGTNDRGAVTCSGKLTPTPAGPQLALHLTGSNVALEEELRDALPPNIGRVWDSLNPRGTIDLPAIDVAFWPAENRLSVELLARPRGDTASIQPAFFPYRMERLRGTLHYRDGQVDLFDGGAAHGRTAISTGGTCKVLPNGGWHVHLERLSVDRILSDHDLVAALPDGLKKALGQLKPTGNVNLRGTVDFHKEAHDRELTTTWNVGLNLQQSSIDCGTKLENIFGAVRLWGSSTGSQFTSRGELELDSLMYKDYQYTQVLGPMWIDNRKVLLGGWPETTERGASRPLTARLLGGTVYGRGRVVLSATPYYHVWARLSGASLAEIARANAGAGKKLNGKVIAQLQLQGARGIESLDGSGSLHLRDADIYELPVMVALLKILSVKPPDSTAFTDSDVTFRIKGPHILLDNIRFTGDAVSLAGQGEMNFERQINLTLHATVGRGDWAIPALRTLIGEASQQIMQIRVEGKLDNPTMRNEPFPGVSQALQELQATMQPGVDRPAVPQAQGPFGRLLPRR